MSEELLPLLQWLAIIIVCGLFYRPLGRILAANIGLTVLTSYIGSYLFLLVTVKLLFTWIRKMVGEKLVGSDLFGTAEFYLGMLSGVVRSGCILFAVLSILHARLITADQLARQAKMQQDNFGDISFPTFGSIQRDVFRTSFTGPYIDKYLGRELIEPTMPGDKLVQHESHRSRRQRELDEFYSSKK